MIPTEHQRFKTKSRTENNVNSETQDTARVQDLLKTIQLPKNIKHLAKKLPKSKYEDYGVTTDNDILSNYISQFDNKYKGTRPSSGKRKKPETYDEKTILEIIQEGEKKNTKVPEALLIGAVANSKELEA